MKVLVTGSAGQLGFDVLRELTVRQIPCIGVDQADFDLTDGVAVHAGVKAVQPDVIVHCAAYTAVDRAESEPEVCAAVNGMGTMNMVRAALDVGASLVYISTDYVFPGTGEDPWQVDDNAGPLNVYGLSKLQGEMAVRSLMTRFFLIRTSWAFGLHGKNFVRTMLRLAGTRDSVSVVNDQFGSPTSTIELAKAVSVLMPTDNYGLFHATCEGSTDWASFTKEIFRIKGLPTEVIPISSEEYQKNNPASAVRPHYSILDNYMLRLTTDHVFAGWQEAIEEYLMA